MKKGACFILSVLLLVSLMTAAALAEGKVIIKNRSGHDLQCKFVMELSDGKEKKKVAQFNVDNGKDSPVNYPESGQYRIYVSYSTGGVKHFAKGNIYDLKANGSYALTIERIITKLGGGLKKVTSEEFNRL